MNAAEQSLTVRILRFMGVFYIGRGSVRLAAIRLSMLMLAVSASGQSATDDNATIASAGPTLSVLFPADTFGKITVFDNAGNVVMAITGTAPGEVEGAVPDGAYWIAVRRIDDPYPAVLKRTEINRDWVSIVRVPDPPYSTRHNIDRTRAEIARINRCVSRGQILKGAA